MMKLRTFLEEFNYKNEHGHDIFPANSIEWFFHNHEHGYKHCNGSETYPYEIYHDGNKHIITNQVARGHGTKNEPQWFKFNKKVKDGWDLSSGAKIDEVPKVS